MDALETILTRRSTRRFSNEPISDETIQTLLNAGMSAPSACNQQPWHFIVVKDRALLDKIAEMHPCAKMCTQAPLAIIPCADPDLQTKIGKDFWIQDLSAATQNILLTARALELGAVWCGVHPRKEHEKNIHAIFQIPKNIIPFAVIAIGYTDVKQVPVDRYKTDRVHANMW
ncbi:MAG: nitroreductase family protein [Pseudomonadota bacterium]